jgi:hypothetical protein
MGVQTNPNLKGLSSENYGESKVVSINGYHFSV